jgi:hypothetical protein
LSCFEDTIRRQVSSAGVTTSAELERANYFQDPSRRAIDRASELWRRRTIGSTGNRLIAAKVGTVSGVPGCH